MLHTCCEYLVPPPPVSCREKVLAARLPPPLVVALWEHAAAVVAAGLLDGLAAVRRCSLEGRANMSLDLSHVEKQVRWQGVPPMYAQHRGVRLLRMAWQIPRNHVPGFGALRTQMGPHAPSVCRDAVAGIGTHNPDTGETNSYSPRLLDVLP